MRSRPNGNAGGGPGAEKGKEDGPWKGETGLSCWALRGEGERGSELGRFVGLGLVGLLWVFGFPFLILTLFSYF